MGEEEGGLGEVRSWGMEEVLHGEPSSPPSPQQVLLRLALPPLQPVQRVAPRPWDTRLPALLCTTRNGLWDSLVRRHASP